MTPWSLLVYPLYKVPRRKIVFANEQVYHIYNRSIALEEAFVGQRPTTRALDLLDFYRFPQEIRYSKFRELGKEERFKYLARVQKKPVLVRIFAYALMPDHFHFLLRQEIDDGIKSFISNFQNAFAKYINTREKRMGSLFLHPFRAKRIETDEILTHVSRYIHLNPVTNFLIEFEQLKETNITSFPYYLNKIPNCPIDTSLILGLLKSGDNYEKFVANQVDYQRELKQIKKFLLE